MIHCVLICVTIGVYMHIYIIYIYIFIYYSLRIVRSHQKVVSLARNADLYKNRIQTFGYVKKFFLMGIPTQIR